MNKEKLMELRDWIDQCIRELEPKPKPVPFTQERLEKILLERGAMGMQRAPFHWDITLANGNLASLFRTEYTGTCLCFSVQLPEPSVGNLCYGCAYGLTYEELIANYAKAAQDAARVFDCPVYMNGELVKEVE